MNIRKLTAFIVSAIFLFTPYFANAVGHNENGLNPEYTILINNQTPADQLITRCYEQTFECIPFYIIRGMSRIPLKLDRLYKSRIGIECLRNNNGFVYTVHKFNIGGLGQGYCFRAFGKDMCYSYSSEGFIMVDGYFVNKLPQDKAPFERIIIGETTLDDIKSFYPEIIICGGLTSQIRFLDGTIMCIGFEERDGMLYVCSLRHHNEDEHGLIKNMLPIDLALITTA